MIIQAVCEVFQSYGFPFAHKIYELQQYYNQCVKANNEFQEELVNTLAQFKT